MDSRDETRACLETILTAAYSPVLEWRAIRTWPERGRERPTFRVNNARHTGAALANGPSNLPSSDHLRLCLFLAAHSGVCVVFRHCKGMTDGVDALQRERGRGPGVRDRGPREDKDLKDQPLLESLCAGRWGKLCSCRVGR